MVWQYWSPILFIHIISHAVWSIYLPLLQKYILSWYDCFRIYGTQTAKHNDFQSPKCIYAWQLSGIVPENP